MTRMSGLIAMVCILLASGCWGGEEKVTSPKTLSAHSQPATDNRTEPAAQPSQTPAIGEYSEGQPVYPLRPEYIDELENPRFAQSWTLKGRVYADASQTSTVQFNLLYKAESDTLSASGYYIDAEGRAQHARISDGFHYDFPSSQEFKDLVRYIQAHADVLFDPTDADRTEGARGSIKDGVEFFAINLRALQLDHVMYSLLVDTLPEEPMPPEMKHVLDTIKADFLPELLSHHATPDSV